MVGINLTLAIKRIQHFRTLLDALLHSSVFPFLFFFSTIVFKEFITSLPLWSKVIRPFWSKYFMFLQIPLKACTQSKSVTFVCVKESTAAYVCYALFVRCHCFLQYWFVQGWVFRQFFLKTNFSPFCDLL